MDIKIRTSERVSLVDCTHKSIGVWGRTVDKLDCVVATNDNNNVTVLGRYETPDNAMEVLEKIQEIILKGLEKGIPGIVIEMPNK